MKHFVFLTLIVVWNLAALAQGCPTVGTFAAYSMDMVDDFASTYPDCRRLPGDVSLTLGKISDYPGFSQIDTVDGNVRCWECGIDSLVGWENLKYISNSLILNEPTNLASLDGLDSLNYIGDNLTFECADNLLSTNGLNSLTHIGGDLTFEDNNDLVEIVGFENITRVLGSLTIESNADLATISGLSNITLITSNLIIDENPMLSSLEGFASLDSIGGYLEIRRNDGLEQIDHLAGLTSIFGLGIYISYNPLLKNLAGLSSISLFTGEISLFENDSLMSLNGIQQIPADEITELYLQDNPRLSICDYENICTYLTDDLGPYTIENNFAGCNTAMEVIANCLASTTAVEQLEGDAVFGLSPNPFKGQATLKTRTPLLNAELHYISTDSRVIKSAYGISGNSITVSGENLSVGVYTLVIVQDQQVIGKLRFMKE